MSLLKYPYTNLHELNLDWIIEQLNQQGPVLSVNGEHGAVTLTGENINRAPNNPQTVEQALSTQGSSIQAARTLLGTTPLPTIAQTVTGAVDELSGDVGDINEKIGNTALPTTSQTLSGAIAEHESDITTLTGFANTIRRVDCTVSIETFANEVTDGTLQYFRMRNSEPNPSWNYSVGFVFAPTTSERIVVMFDRSGTSIAMKAKYGDVWLGWRSVGLTEI